MPYIYEDDQKDEKDQSQQQIGATNQVVVSQAGGSSANSNSSGASNQRSSSLLPTSSGSYVNSADYLKANQSQQFGKQVAGNIQGEIDNSRTVQNQVKQDFTQEVDKTRVQYNPELVQKAVTNPQKVISSTTDKEAFQKLLNANYTGPKALSDSSEQYTQVQNAYADAKDASEASKSEAGRFGLLDRYYERPSYNQGQKTLDNLLLQNDPSARDQFSKVQSNQEKHTSEYGDLMGFLSDYGTNAATETLDTRAQARAALGMDDAGNVIAGKGAIGGLQQELSNRLSDYQTQQKSAYSELLTALHNGDITPDQAELMGLAEGTRLYNIDPTSYLIPSQDPNINMVASAEEHEKFRALNELAQLENNFLSDPSQAGLYDPIKPYQFDLDSFLVANETNQRAYENETSRPRFANGAADGLNNPFTNGSLADEIAEANRLEAHFEANPLDKSSTYYQNIAARIKKIRELEALTKQQYGYDNILK